MDGHLHRRQFTLDGCNRSIQHSILTRVTSTLYYEGPCTTLSGDVIVDTIENLVVINSKELDQLHLTMELSPQMQFIRLDF